MRVYIQLKKEQREFLERILSTKNFIYNWVATNETKTIYRVLSSGRYMQGGPYHQVLQEVRGKWIEYLKEKHEGKPV